MKLILIICLIAASSRAAPQGYKYPDASLVIHALTTAHGQNSDHPQTVRISSVPATGGFKYAAGHNHLSTPQHTLVSADSQNFGRTAQPIRVTPQPQNSFHQVYKHPNPHTHVHHSHSQSTGRPQTSENSPQLTSNYQQFQNAQSSDSTQNVASPVVLSLRSDDSPNVAPRRGYHYNKPTNAPIISKNIYIHTAPDEEDEETHEISVGPAQKQYKVIFIRAPVNKIPKLSIAPQKKDDRTLIYVLSKKTDASDIQILQPPEPKENSKPEVYFIKYKTPQEALNAQQQIQAHYDTLGGTTQVSDEVIAPIQSVIGSYDNQGGSTSSSDALEVAVPALSNRYLPAAN